MPLSLSLADTHPQLELPLGVLHVAPHRPGVQDGAVGLVTELSTRGPRLS